MSTATLHAATKPVAPVNGRSPRWFHPSGKNMRLGGYHICDLILREYILIGDRHNRQIQLWPIRQGFKLIWLINETRSPRHFRGEIVLDNDQLQLAFGLCRTVSNGYNGHWDRKVQGLFIGRGPYLNFPGPGTGEDGDPNISVFVTEEIQDAVRKLVASQR